MSETRTNRRLTENGTRNQAPITHPEPEKCCGCQLLQPRRDRVVAARKYTVKAVQEGKNKGALSSNTIVPSTHGIKTLRAHPFTVAGSFDFPATPASTPGSLLLSLSTLVLMARCGDREPALASRPPAPPGPTERVARREEDLLVELERCGLEEGPFMVDVWI